MHTPHDLTWYEGELVANAMIYHRHEINGVMWQERKATNKIRSGSEEADRVTVYIPSLEYGFKTGDYLVKGIVMDEISPTFKVTDLLKKYPHSVKITSVDVKDYAETKIGHVQIGGV